MIQQKLSELSLYSTTGTMAGLYTNLVCAIKLLENNTCIKFMEVNWAENNSTDHFVFFVHGPERC